MPRVVERSSIPCLPLHQRNVLMSPQNIILSYFNAMLIWMAEEQILGLGRSIAWSQMKPCILSSSSGHTDLVLVSEKFLKTPWGRGSFSLTALLSAPLSSGIRDNKTALLRIIWGWIEHEFLATPLLHRKVEGFFYISSLLCVLS